MRHLLSCLLLACAGVAVAQVEPPEPLPYPDLDLDLLQGGPAWLVGDLSRHGLISVPLQNAAIRSGSTTLR